MTLMYKKDSIELNNLLELDKWILHELAQLQEDVVGLISIIFLPSGYPENT